MDPVLTDIRILKLAEMYERAYEAFVLQMAQRHIHDDTIQAQLRLLADPADRHAERIAEELERLNAKLGHVDEDLVERAALQDVLEIERSARGFYLRYVEEIHDPRVADLFRALAREEAQHIRVAEDAIRLHDRKVASPRVTLEAVQLLHVGDDAEHEVQP